MVINNNSVIVYRGGAVQSKRCNKMELKLKYAKDRVPTTRGHVVGGDRNGRRYHTAEPLKSKRISVIIIIIFFNRTL